MSLPNSKSDGLLSPAGGQEHFVTGQWLWAWWQAARQEAIAHAVPCFEVDWLLQHVAPIDRLELHLGSFQGRSRIPLTVAPETLIQAWQQRIQARVPVQYLVGRVAWREFSLQVSPAVLIPRPETELVIDLVTDALAATGSEPTLAEGHWADLGTGSGAIALGLATALPQATIHAVDCSAEALAIAQANAASYLLTSRIQFHRGSWLEPLAHLQGQLSGLVSNPPYIPTAMVRSLQPEVTQHEPLLALDGGPDGLDCLRHLVTTAPRYLRSGGLWLVELMAGQATQVAELLTQQGEYDHIRIYPDLAGIERFVLAHRR